jgi:hypothetical protein
MEPLFRTGCKGGIDSLKQPEKMKELYDNIRKSENQTTIEQSGNRSDVFREFFLI